VLSDVVVCWALFFALCVGFVVVSEGYGWLRLSAYGINRHGAASGRHLECGICNYVWVLGKLLLSVRK
jgi:hypothetical protein